MALISYRNLTVSFGGPLLLDDVGITIDKKERICLLGRNGEGKSTLLRILAEQVKPDAGEVDRGAVSIQQLRQLGQRGVLACTIWLLVRRNGTALQQHHLRLMKRH